VHELDKTKTLDGSDGKNEINSTRDSAHPPVLLRLDDVCVQSVEIDFPDASRSSTTRLGGIAD
jgi:hypothetical protein